MAASVAITAGATVNETSFMIGDYETLKKAAIDFYIIPFKNRVSRL